MALSAWGTDILREKSVCGCSLVRLLFLGASAAATSLGLYYFQRTHGLTGDEASTVRLLRDGDRGRHVRPGLHPRARSDRFGRKAVIYAGMGLTGMGLFGLAVAPTPELAVALFVPAGIGIGAFLSVDWALMSDVIPKHTSARYMGILNAGTAMATPVFLIVGGLTMDTVGRTLGRLRGRWPPCTWPSASSSAALALRQVDARRRELGSRLPDRAGARRGVTEAGASGEADRAAPPRGDGHLAVSAGVDPGPARGSRLLFRVRGEGLEHWPPRRSSWPPTTTPAGTHCWSWPSARSARGSRGSDPRRWTSRRASGTG